MVPFERCDSYSRSSTFEAFVHCQTPDSRTLESVATSEDLNGRTHCRILCNAMMVPVLRLNRNDITVFRESPR